MSGTSSEAQCPNCEETMSVFSDYKPFDTVNGECIFCGFYFYTKAEQMSLKELNYLRKNYNDNNDCDLKPLKKLPKIDKELL